MKNNNLSLYRKYRPQKFDQIIGQYFIVKTLQLSILNNNISHAYIFSGSRGTGKTSIAKIFAKAINCENFKNDICDNCKICNSINKNTNIDIVELDAASNNGVNEIKELIDTVKYSPTESKYKVYIVDEAHMLSTSAWNALLKTIEEPPKHVVFIFATTEFHKIPSTIVSRCQRFDFSKLTIKELEDLISYVSQNENILISNSARNKIALLSNGGARDCLSILDQLSNYTNNNINVEDIDNLFGLISNNYIIELLNFLIKGDNANLFSLFNKITNKNIDYLWLINQIINFCLDKAIYLKTNNSNLLNSLSVNELYSFECNDYNLLLSLVENFKETYENIKKYGNSRFYFELALLKNSNKNIENNNSVLQVQEIDIEKETKNTDNNQIDLSSIFKTTTVTNEYKLKEKKNKDSIEKLTSQQEDKYDFNYMVDENKSIINPYQINNESMFLESINIPDYDWLSIFLSIAANNNSEIKKNDVNKLELIKSNKFATTNIERLILNIEKILISSQNGIIILFNYKNEADKFNEYFWSEQSYFEICDKLDSYDRLVYAIDKKKATEWLEIYKQNKNKQFEDVQLSLLKYKHNDNLNNNEDLLKQISDILKKG